MCSPGWQRTRTKYRPGPLFDKDRRRRERLPACSRPSPSPHPRPPSPDSPDHGAVHKAGRSRQDRAMTCGSERALAGGGRLILASASPCVACATLFAALATLRARAAPACATSRLCQSIPLIPPNPTYPTESHVIPPIPLIPPNPTESHRIPPIPLIPPIPPSPGESRFGFVLGHPTCASPAPGGADGRAERRAWPWREVRVRLRRARIGAQRTERGRWSGYGLA